MKLFARYGSPTSTEIKYVSGTSDTKASGEVGYAVQITQVATHSRVTTGVAQADPLAEDEILTINGKTISLTAGMTQAQVISTINARTSETGVTASATDINGSGTGQYLTLTTAGYGSKAQVTALSNKSNGAPGSSGIGNVSVTESSPSGEAATGTGAAGVDVAGTINGAAAVGTGRLLKSTAGDAKGLTLLVQAVTTGDYGSVAYTVGASAMLNAELEFLTEDDNSSIKTSEDTLQKRIDDMTESIEHMNESVTSEQERIKAQFNRMELALSQLQTQSNYLTSQLAQIKNNWG
jgi:FtsZ-binding cell division protein ZapB